MGQSLACLGIAVALVAALWRWELPVGAPAPAPVGAAAPGRVKPKVKKMMRVVRPVSTDSDNSNSSYAALGIRATWVPGDAPSWMRRAAWRLEELNRAATSTLKDLARKSILGRVS